MNNLGGNNVEKNTLVISPKKDKYLPSYFELTTSSVPSDAVKTLLSVKTPSKSKKIILKLS